MPNRELENKSEIKKALEDAVADYEQVGDGRLCGKDAANIANLLREQGFSKMDTVKFINGPLEHYNHKLGGVVKARHHMVAELDSTWVIDPALKPQERVFETFNEYLKKSGIKILT